MTEIAIYLDIYTRWPISLTVSLSLAIYRTAHYSFEKAYDPMPVLNWMTNYPSIPVVACMLYAALIFGGQYYFSKREPLKWRSTLAAWNLFLSVFSTMGMLRTAPQLAHNLVTSSLRDNLCEDPRISYGSGSTGLWVQLFILSKFP